MTLWQGKLSREDHFGEILRKVKRGMETTRFGQIDPRNQLNDLSNSDWLLMTKSVWLSDTDVVKPNDSRPNSVVLRRSKVEPQRSFTGVFFSNPRPPDKLKETHPATFAESDVRKLILFFTKSGETVFDPFLGSGSTMIASAQLKRSCIGVELFWKWIDLSKHRMRLMFSSKIKDYKVRSGKSVRIRFSNGCNYRVLRGDSRIAISRFEGASADFVLTSPPYWSILEKNGSHKVSLTRKKRELPTTYGTAKNNLSNIQDYATFLFELKRVFKGCNRVLKKRKYMCVIASDFRNKSKFHAFHMDLTRRIESCGFNLEGIIILASNNKRLYPYGMPAAFIPNIHHSYILVFRRN